MPSTYEPIATTTLSSATTTITFDSISSAYTDLRLMLVAAGNSNNFSMTFNNDTSALYTFTDLYAFNTTRGTDRGVSQASINPLFFTGILELTLPSFFMIDIFSYANTAVFKSVFISTNNDRNASATAQNMVALYRSTSALTRIDLTANGGTTFAIGTTATIYGILKA